MRGAGITKCVASPPQDGKFVCGENVQKMIYEHCILHCGSILASSSQGLSLPAATGKERKMDNNL